MPMLRTTLLLFCWVISPSAHAEARDWAFVQAVGGLAVESPIRTTNGWSLPIRADIAGIQRITIEPTTMNSGLVCERTDARVEGQSIFIAISSALARKNLSSKCPAAQLGAIAPGHYRVFYRGSGEQPHFLSEVSVGA